MSSQTITIPGKYVDRLQKILDDLEQETGLMYQFTINQFGIPTDHKYIIGDFAKRSYQIMVYRIASPYTDLNGVYTSKKAFYDRIEELRCSEFFSEIKKCIDSNGQSREIGKCRKCNSFNDNKKDYSPNYITNDCCQNCYTSFRGKWCGIRMSGHSSNIIVGEEGNPIGKYCFVNDL